jgi:phage repressor protein C with HTH and peptisase S24 domain
MDIWTTQEEAERLAARFVGRSRAEFAREHKVPGGQSIIYQHVTARRPISLAAALAYAKGFSCSLEEISPRLARETLGAALQTGAQTGRQQTVFAHDAEDALPDGFIYVPESKIEFSAGNGRAAVIGIVEDEVPATYRREWFQKYGINPDRVRRFRVAGDSMEPMLYARDTILVNMDETNIVDGKMYAIRYGDELRVKYLSRRIDGTLLLRSVNPAYPVEEVAAELAQEHITVIGRVRDTSGTGGL